MKLENVQNKFYEMYGKGTIRCFHSPGRVNLIGEHTDYNGGCVFPCALSLGTYGVARKRADDSIKLASVDFNETAEVSLKNITYNEKYGWGNYMLGIIKEFIDRDCKIGGLELLISGNIPNGAGLSSSASIELLMSVVLNELYACEFSMLEMVKLSQHSENNFIGVNCGIMDQFAVGMGQRDKAIYLNCKTLDYKYVDAVLNGYKIVIGNTNKRRELSESKYNERRAECGKAVEYLNAELDIELLGDIKSPEELAGFARLITEPVILNRARHVVEEIHRTAEAAEALTAGDLARFGELMSASHNSLRDLYEVTGKELDTLVDEALKQDGVLGSRMTGAGFGGCTVSLVKDDCLERFISEVGAAYQKRVGLKADFYIAEIGGGSREL